MAPKRTTRSTRVLPVTPTPNATPTTTVTEAQLQALINQGVAAAMAEAEASRVRNGYNSNGSGPRHPKQLREFCVYISKLHALFKSNYATWHLHNDALILHEVEMPMLRPILLKQLMPCQVKGTDVVAYSRRFQQLDLICSRMFPEEIDKIEKYIGGLPDMIHGSIKASKPKTMQEAIVFTTELMDDKPKAYAERQAERKRKYDDLSKNNQNQQIRARSPVLGLHTAGKGPLSTQSAVICKRVAMRATLMTLEIWSWANNNNNRNNNNNNPNAIGVAMSARLKDILKKLPKTGENKKENNRVSQAGMTGPNAGVMCLEMGQTQQRRAMVNTRTDAELAAAVQAAVDAMLPQIREQVREEYRAGASGGNPPPATIHTWLERFNKQKPHSFEKAVAPVDAENWISHMEKIFDVMDCNDAFKRPIGWFPQSRVPFEGYTHRLFATQFDETRHEKCRRAAADKKPDDQSDFGTLLSISRPLILQPTLDSYSRRVIFGDIHAPEFIYHGSLPGKPMKIISALKARTLLSHGCEGFLATIHDTTSDVSSIHDQPIVSEFQDVFPEELPGIPPIRDVEFNIELIPGAEPISKAPYRMAPIELKELKDQFTKEYVRARIIEWHLLQTHPFKTALDSSSLSSQRTIYASSSWCLDELVQIMDCQKTGEQTAYPVFFHVEPTQVRKQSGPFGEAFSENKKKDTAGKWIEALKRASNLVGRELQATASGNEAEFIKKVVREISLELRSINSGFDENLVGMDTRVKDGVSSLEIGIDEVRMIGIKGMGGAGKTTTARAVFDHLCADFEAISFVENVREVSTTLGLKKLQEQVLSKVLKENVTLDSVNDGKNMMKRRMCGIMVLLVLDDVDHIDQLKALAGEPKWFKASSRIIITTRDEQVLKAHRLMDVIRNIALLSDQEATSLFSRYAFGRENPLQGYEALSEKVVRYAAGLPLTVEVLGLEDDYKEIFLDIACILKGETKEDAIKILECCGFHARNGLKVLEQRSLITVSSIYTGIGFELVLGMHDHIEEMGKNIVCREHPDEPNKHSRLWIKEEIEDILANDMVSRGRLGMRPIRKKMRKEEENVKISTFKDFPTSEGLISSLEAHYSPRTSISSTYKLYGSTQLNGKQTGRRDQQEHDFTFWRNAPAARLEEQPQRLGEANEPPGSWSIRLAGENFSYKNVTK
ncbi:Toll/interleukin-1 receptor domain-containing protein [Tanacetum coccineum]|uniref:Toll/interleukin-1 receptor domain-containing protein n=1 Tax=Tanacetum coccineum TaxID=301880 RepID=A0ABQ4ZRM8_9ASTR